MWPGGVVVRAVDLRLKKSRVRISAVPLSGNNLGQVVSIRVPVTKQYDLVPVKGAVMPCGWEGNRRSGVAPAMRHRLQWFIHLRAHGLTKEDEHLAYTPHGGMALLFTTVIIIIIIIVIIV